METPSQTRIVSRGPTVDACWVLTPRMLELTDGAIGSLRWPENQQRTDLAALYSVKLDEAEGLVNLLFGLEGKTVRQSVRVTRSTVKVVRPGRRGFRWYLRCPMETNGRPCGRRCSKLYLPPFASDGFGCRWCCGIVYPSKLFNLARLRKRLGLPKGIANAP